ncbi:uncharacterized protein PRCAT00005358001 [Priceomyces carsonii]|uniref:uncharacterized protein n=1 Tax=Priceomyces carsonii TaxID=28549 RepID=UPI002EDBB3F7|nr:unnamed protein product [Priceomyces carsonii]
MLPKTVRYISEKKLFKEFIRSLSRRKDNVLLADALNLLSPLKAVKNESSYKPSLFNNLTKGPAQEQYANLDLIGLNMGKNHDSSRFLNDLLAGIRSSSMVNRSTYELLRMEPKELSGYIKTLTDENKLIQIAEIIHIQNRMSFKLMMDILLNKNLKSLDMLPINATDIESNENLTWEPIQYVQFNILLLKKWHDIKRPLLIIKNLKKHFDDTYYPSIQRNFLSPFYERILWKFYFEYVKQYDEIHYIRELNSIKSTFLIWESSTTNSIQISDNLLANNTLLTFPQRIFFRVHSSDFFRQKIYEELQVNEHSPLLSKLKKISIKFKLYQFDDSLIGFKRTNCYSLFNLIENLIMSELQTVKTVDSELNLILNEIRDFKRAAVMKLDDRDRLQSDLEGYFVMNNV